MNKYKIIGIVAILIGAYFWLVSFLEFFGMAIVASQFIIPEILSLGYFWNVVIGIALIGIGSLVVMKNG